MPESVVQVLAAVVPAVNRRGQLADPLLEGGPRGLVEGAEDLVELDRRLDLLVGQGPAVLQKSGGLVPWGDLHVGLAEQGLLPQDRLRVLRDRRVLVLDLELDVGARALL